MHRTFPKIHSTQSIEQHRKPTSIPPLNIASIFNAWDCVKNT